MPQECVCKSFVMSCPLSIPLACIYGYVWVMPLSPLQECYRSHRFMNVNVTAVLASRMLPLSPFQECYRCHSFKNVTAVTASRMLLRSPLQKCCRSHRFENDTGVTVSRM